MALAILLVCAVLGGGVWADLYQLDIIQAVLFVAALVGIPVLLHEVFASKLAGYVLDEWGNKYPLAPAAAILIIGGVFYLGFGQNLPITSRYVNNPVMIYAAFVLLGPLVLAILSLCTDRLLGGYAAYGRRMVARYKAEDGVAKPEWSPPAGSASFGGGDFDKSKFKR